MVWLGIVSRLLRRPAQAWTLHMVSLCKSETERVHTHTHSERLDVSAEQPHTHTYKGSNTPNKERPPSTTDRGFYKQKETIEGERGRETIESDT